MFDTPAVLTARELMTRDVIGFETTATVDDARRWMQEWDFDAVPVFQNGNQTDDGPGVTGGDAVGYIDQVLLDDLTSQGDVEVGQIMNNITINCMVESHAGFEEVIDLLFERPWYFIGSRNGLNGVLTRSDFNKPPASAYFYLLIHEFELRLRELIDSLGIDWEEILQNKAQLPRGLRSRYDSFLEQVEESQEKSVIEDIELRKIEYTTLTHLREIVRYSDELQSVLPISVDQIHEIKELRNDVAHPTPRSIISYTGGPSPVSKTPAGRRGMGTLQDVHFDLSRALETLRKETTTSFD